MHRDRRWYRCLPGDLVSWTNDGNHFTGVVIDVYPANIYEKEVCSIYLEGQTHTVGSRYLKILVENSDDASIYNGVTSRVEDTRERDRHRSDS